MLDFSAYLDAKFALDSRSLNPTVLENLRRALALRSSLRCLDLGSGKGATIKRLVDLCPAASLEITALDLDPGLLTSGAEQLSQDFQKRGFQILRSATGLVAQTRTRRISIAFACDSALIWNPGMGEFDLIAAHAFMDLMPLAALCEKVLALLKPAGIFYASLNYDGETALIPPYPEESLEREILEYYDLSMEQRRLDHAATGGAYSGRRLVGALSRSGFEIEAYGASDWEITPLRGQYRDRDAACLQALLDMIHAEAQDSGRFNPELLARWYRERCAAIDVVRLGMIVHQLDILAAKPSSPAA